MGKFTNFRRYAMPLVVLALGVTASVWLVATRPAAKPSPPAETVWPVRTVPAEARRVRGELRLYGEVVAGREAEIRSLVDGRVVVLDPDFRSGTFVDERQRLVGIDPFDYEIALRERQAGLDEAHARLAELEAEAEAENELLALRTEQIALRERDEARIADLAKRQQSSAQALDESRLALNAARQERVRARQTIATLKARIAQQRAVVLRSEALRAQAERDLADTTIEAPFAGYLQDIVIARGKRVGVGESLGRLIDPAALEVRFELPNGDYARLVDAAVRRVDGTHPLAGTTVDVVWRLGESRYRYTGVVTRAGAEVDSAAGGVEMYVEITDGPRALLRAGAFVEIVVPDVEYRDVVELPESAIADDGRVYYVDDGRLVAREVEVVREFGDRVLVRGDFPVGAGIVAERFPTIGPGVAVRAL